MRILNLTQHAATPDQIAAGVVEPGDKAAVQKLITFDTLPDRHTLDRNACELANMAIRDGAEAVMIGGAPYFMAPLENEFHRIAPNVKVLYAFSVRDCVEVPQPDGSVKKTFVFKHAGFVEA
jgi:hypothetical protein